MEYPCPSLDNIPLPDGAQPVKDRKKTKVCPAVSPGTSDTHISTDGQLTPFNMADVPLPSTKYNAEPPPLPPTLSIPLPEGNSSSSSSNNNSSLASSSASSSSSSSSSASSKTLVDKLFEDFLSQKIKQPERSTKTQNSSKPAFTNSVEEIKRFLDKEINQLSCKAGFAEAGPSSLIGTEHGTEPNNQITTEKESDSHEENLLPGNSSSAANQRIPVMLPMKIKISDSSVARISCGHLATPSDNQSQSEELVDEVTVIEEVSLPAAKVVCLEDTPEKETQIQSEPISQETDLQSNGLVEVEEKSAKSNKKHKHKKKKSHKHSKDKNKSTPKLRLHSKKHKSVTKSHSKPKRKSSNSTKSLKKTSKTSHSKSKSSKKSKKTKIKTDSKLKPLAEMSETEKKCMKKSETCFTPHENQSLEVSGKVSSLGQIPHLNVALKSSQKENRFQESTITEADSKFCEQFDSKSPECSPARTLTDPKCHSEDSLVQKDINLSPFQAKALPLKTFSSSLSSAADLISSAPVTTPVAFVTPMVTASSSLLQLPTLPTKLSMSPSLESEPYFTPAAELPAVSELSHEESVTQSVPVCPSVSTVLSPQSNQTIPVVCEALESTSVSKQSLPMTISPPLNQSLVLPPAKMSSQPPPPVVVIVEPDVVVLESPPSSQMTCMSQEKDTLLNCSQSVVPGTNVSAETAQNKTELTEHDKVNFSLTNINKNSVAGKSSLLGLAAYFKSKTQSQSPDSTKEKKAIKSSSKMSKSSSDSSDESSSRKRSRSNSRSGNRKYSSSDKRKKTRPRSRSWSRSRSRSWSKSRRRPLTKSIKKRGRSRSRSHSVDRSRQSSFRSNKRRFSSRSPSRSRKKTYGRSRSRSRSRGRIRVMGHGSSRSRSPSKKATYRRSRSRSRSYSRGRYRHRISSHSVKSRSRSRSRSNIRSRDKRSRSRSSGHHRDYRPSNNKFRRARRRSRSRSSSASSSRSRHRRSRSKSGSSLVIDKVKLHEIAVKKLLESGQAPKEEIASLRAGGKTVQGLIDYCKRISQKELESDSGDSTQAALKSDEEEESPFIHHPFRLRETQPNIVLNIKNSKPLPVLTPQEKLIQSSTLRLQFPVSSGSQHRAKESQWVPVEKNSATDETTPSAAASNAASEDGLVSEVSSSNTLVAGTNLSTIGVQSSQVIETNSNSDSVFPEYTEESINISQAMTDRMLAVQKLQENPNDVQALNQMYKAQQEVNRWAQSKQLPGQFTGSTGAKVMTQEELIGPDKRFQAWAKKLFFQVISVDVVPLAAR